MIIDQEWVNKNYNNESVFEIPKGITGISTYAFNSREQLKKVILPEGLTIIGYGSFHHCTNLTEINFPNSLIRIDGKAFTGCFNLFSGISSVIFPHNLESIGSSSFTACKSIRSFLLPQNLQSIGDRAFSECLLLTTITIPKTVKKIGRDIFHKCLNLKSINVVKENDRYTSVDGILFDKNCKNLITCPCNYQKKDVILPSKTKIIEDFAFEYCENIVRIVLPEGLIKIKGYAFSNCTNLETVVFPKTVRSINRLIFDEVYHLKSLTIPINIAADFTNILSDDYFVIFSDMFQNYNKNSDVEMKIPCNIKPSAETKLLYYDKNTKEIVSSYLFGYFIEGISIEDVAGYLQAPTIKKLMHIPNFPLNIFLALSFFNYDPKISQFIKELAVKATEVIIGFSDMSALRIMTDNFLISKNDIYKCLKVASDRQDKTAFNILYEYKKQLLFGNL